MNNYPVEGVKLIQDNDSKHSSDLCRSALADSGIHWVIYVISEKI